MKRRDADIAAASEAFAIKKMELREKQAALDEKAKFLEQEKANNKEVRARKQRQSPANRLWKLSRSPFDRSKMMAIHMHL
jgi:Tfp pilus assembly protein PilE